MSESNVSVAYRPNPFKHTKIDCVAPEGSSLTQMIDGLGLKALTIIHEGVFIYVDDELVERERWDDFKLVRSQIVTVGVVPAGGGGGQQGGGKNTWRTVAMIAVMVVAAAATWYIGGQGAWFAGGMMGLTAAQTAAAVGVMAGMAISMAGSFLVNALIPLPMPKTNQDEGKNYLSGMSNRMDPYGPVPRVFGQHRVFPRYSAMPYTELVGTDEQYLRCLFVVGAGKYQLTDFKIGDTPISEYQDIEYQVIESDGHTPISLFPNDVSEQGFGITLNTNVQNIRTTGVDAQEISVEITFPQGLHRTSSGGKDRGTAVTLQCHYSPVGQNAWQPWNGTDGLWTIDSKYMTGMKQGWRWTVAKGQYDVRVVRVSPDNEDDHYYDTIWTCLRSVTYGLPVTLPGLTLIALRIRASKQLNGTLDQFNVIATSKLNVWNGSQWLPDQPTRNPAWAFVEVLCGSSNKRPLLTSRLNLTDLKAFADRCTAAGWNFDAVIDYKTNAWELLRQVCAVGRATPGMVDNLYTVVEDLPRSTPVQHFGPRNSWGFSGSRVFPDDVHALRIRFPNAAKFYQEDECIVYADKPGGGTYSAADATLYETLDFFGITDYNQVWQLARYHMAVLKLRPETYAFNTDVEHLICTRGDLVRITHDALLIGLGQGRIQAISTTSITVDDTLAMELGKTYGFQFRRSDGSFKTCTVTTAAGEFKTFTINPPMNPADLPAVGDLCFFGEAGKISIDCLVNRIEPGPDLTARLTCVPYNPAIYTAGEGAIPPWYSNITLPPVVNRTPPKPQIIEATYTVEETSLTSNGVLEIRMYVGFAAQSSGFVPTSVGLNESAPPDVIQGFQAEYREDGSNWIALPLLGANERSFTFDAANNRVYDVRIRSFSLPGLYSDWEEKDAINVSLAGDAIADVTGLQVVGGGTSFATKDLEIEWTPVYGAVDYEVTVKTADGLTTLRTEWTAQARYLYDLARNLNDGGPRASLQISVKARNRAGIMSAIPASAVFTNPAPGTVQGLGKRYLMGGVEFYWTLTTASDFAYYEYRTKITAGGSWSGWNRTVETNYVRILTQAEKDSYGATAEIFFEVREVDRLAQAGGSAATSQTAGGLAVQSTDIANFAITASKLYTKIPVVEGLAITHNSPTAGRIHLSACTIYYNGVAYSIAAFDATTTQKYIYWFNLASTLAGTSTHPVGSVVGWNPERDFIIAVNISGTGQAAWNGIANEVIGSAYIQQASIGDAQVASLSGTKINAQSSLAIGLATTFGSDGCQIEYNAGNPRMYLGNGSNQYVKFDGTNLIVSGQVNIVGSATGYANFTDKPSVTQIFFQATAPSVGMVAGDLWIRSTDNKIHRYANSAWGEIQDDQIAAAISNAATAQSTADGKIKCFAQATAPTATGDGDIWIETDNNNLPYRWNSGTSQWVPYGYDVATWTKIAGSGKPQDNATVGATWGSNISGQPADAAILNSYNQYGPNLLPNADWDGSNWLQWAFDNSPYSLPYSSGFNYDSTWTLTQDKGATLWFQQTNIANNPAAYFYIYSGKIPVTPGQRYCFAVYSGAHRCKITCYGNWYDVNGANITNTTVDAAATNNNELNGGKALSGYKRIASWGVAPANAATCRLLVVKYDTLPGYDNSFMFLARPGVWEVGASQATIPPWSPCDATVISGGYIRTELLTASNIVTGNLNANLIQSGAINANLITVGSINANLITTGTLTADRIVSDSIVRTALYTGVSNVASGSSFWFYTVGSRPVMHSLTMFPYNSFSNPHLSLYDQWGQCRAIYGTAMGGGEAISFYFIRSGYSTGNNYFTYYHNYGLHYVEAMVLEYAK